MRIGSAGARLEAGGSLITCVDQEKVPGVKRGISGGVGGGGAPRGEQFTPPCLPASPRERSQQHRRLGVFPTWVYLNQRSKGTERHGTEKTMPVGQTRTLFGAHCFSKRVTKNTTRFNKQSNPTSIRSIKELAFNTRLCTVDGFYIHAGQFRLRGDGRLGDKRGDKAGGCSC